MRRLEIEKKRLHCDLELRFQDGKWTFRNVRIGERVEQSQLTTK